MRVIDSRWEGQHGIGRFATEVARRLPGFDRIELSGSPSAALDTFRLTQYLLALKPEIFLSPGYNAPLGKPCPFVFCVHDLNHLVMPENSSFLKRAYYRHVMMPALRNARIVLTVSEFARDSICKWANLSDSRVCNVGNGVSEAFVPAAETVRCDNYFLYVGNHRPHKNFPRLLEAYAKSGLQEQFALVSTGSATPELQRRIEDMALGQRVSFVGQVSDSELASLYQGATALALVSLYEGFGLPVLEAMSCGTPVITSNLASMPEVVGEAGFLVDPYDVEAIAGALVKVASDTALRQRLRRLGIERSRLYSWDSTAARVRAALTASL